MNYLFSVILILLFLYYKNVYTWCNISDKKPEKWRKCLLRNKKGKLRGIFIWDGNSFKILETNYDAGYGYMEWKYFNESKIAMFIRKRIG